MSSIRKFKKQIYCICGDIADEILIAAHATKDFDKEKAYSIVGDIASLQVDTISKCKFSYDKIRKDFDNDAAYRRARHAYTKSAFCKLHEDLETRLQETVKAMNAAMPKESKNK